MISALPGLDRETKATYYLSITAQDGGIPPLTAICAVRVFISDTNDNKPVFSPTLYLTSISEATPPGSDIIPVHASDVDLGVNAEIEFSIVGGDAKTQFQVRRPFRFFFPFPFVNVHTLSQCFRTQPMYIQLTYPVKIARSH